MRLNPRAAAMPTLLSAALFAAHAAGAQPPTETTPMQEEDQVARTTVEGDGARLEVAFDPDGSALAVRYRIRNTGTAELAVFDRGDRHAVLTRRLVAGEVPPPRFDAGPDGLLLSHVARGLPRPTPTVPPVPLAARLAAGQALDGAFAFDLSLASSEGPRRVRWCLGVAPFDGSQFDAAESAGEVAVWTAPFEMAQAQQRLCTPWFDLDAGTFDAP